MMNKFVQQATQANNAATNAIIAKAASADPLDLLAHEWQQMKELEAQARERRIEIEQDIINLVGVQDEGTTNRETSQFKVKTVGKLTRSLDEKAIQADWDNLPDAIKKCIKWKPSLDTKSLRALESMREDLLPTVAHYTTTKPAKPSISVEGK